MNRRYATDAERRSELARKARIRNRASRAEIRLRHVWNAYRLAADLYTAALAAGCAICPDDFSDGRIAVDHDHACDHPDRGRFCCARCVRGVLCYSCNLRVGAAERGQNRDADVAAYLGRDRGPIEMQVALF